MKQYSLIILLFLFLISCKKDAGKHCPLIIDHSGDQVVDLEPLKGFPGIMDTLAKYPQLKVMRLYVIRAVYDTTHYSANAVCGVYANGVLIFDYYYSLWSNNYGAPDNFPAGKIPAVSISAEPAIGLEEANTIAKKAAYFEHCTISALGFKNYSFDSVANYKLIWRIKESEKGYPRIDIDAQSGEILSLIEKQIYID